MSDVRKWWWLLCLPLAAACSGSHPPEPGPARASQAPKPVGLEVHATPKLTSVEAPGTDALGRPLRVDCQTCHSLRPDAPLPTSVDQLRQFHQGLQFNHGGSSCASCHVQGRADALRLADGQVIPMQDAMRLCAQCHGPQFRDYRQGSHGGMNGTWDPSRGPRQRNHCVDCHDPHAPQFQPTHPVLRPRDRHPASGSNGAHL